MAFNSPVEKSLDKLLANFSHNARVIIKTCGERAGLEKLINRETGQVKGISPHRLRDAFATHAIKLDFIWRINYLGIVNISFSDHCFLNGFKNSLAS